ncbi:hypothetical protein [Nonomuraea roseola]|uniref:hypothetical protein n=1 Tax=Nonomuraea roseola TaxID=46179 RepID=UPI0031F92913
MNLPAARGPITAALFGRLTGPPGGEPLAVHEVDDEDLHLALFVCYELHYQGFDEVDERWEWEPSLLRTRAELERRFESALRELVPRPPAVPPAGGTARAGRAGGGRRRPAAVDVPAA